MYGEASYVCMEQPILHGAAIDLYGEQPEVHGAGQFPRSSDRFARRKRVPCGPPYKASKLTFPLFSHFTPALGEYKNCNIDKRPASAFVTKTNASASTVKKIQDILMAANVTDLKTGGIVSSSIENLVPYEDTAKKYVGSYGDHYNALTDGPPCDTTTPAMTMSSTDTASSVLVSFTLSIIGIFAFLQLA